VFQKLVSHNIDLNRLVEKGYAVSFDNTNHLVVRDIPYLDEHLNLKIGAIVAKIEFIDQVRVKQTDHQVFFAGSPPYGLDGKAIPNLAGGPTPLALSAASADVVVQRSFSNKPKATGKFTDFFEKIESYVGIISGPAIERHQANPLTFRPAPEDVPADSVFKIHDTLTSRAEIGELAAKFREDVVAVIGLGGTGSYLLDFIVKTPVREVRAFDLDPYHVHNAFRSPGRLELSEFGKSKADVYQSRYENFRHGLSVVSKHIDATCVEDFKGVTFAFVCVDKGSARSKIFDLLISSKIPFIDVGMGLHRKTGAIGGMLRTTYYSIERAAQMREEKLAPTTDAPGEEYRTNIQIAELNALNACFAVLRFKQIRGFYADVAALGNMLFEVGDMKTVGDTGAKED
jgi:hypothetical protein